MSRICIYCAHAYTNNRDLKADGFKGNSMACRAYPDGIPYNYPRDDHKSVQYNQVGNFVFEKASDELQDIVRYDGTIDDQRFAEFGHY